MPEAVIRLPTLPPLIDPREDVFPSLWRGAVSEFTACLIFVFVGTGAVVACQAQLGESTITVPALTLIALAHGFTIVVMVYAIGEISGGHVNPAVTWAVMITGKMSLLRGGIFILSQLFGAIVGSSLLKSILPKELEYGMGCHSLNSQLTPGQGFGAEFIFTFIFIFVVFGTAISPFAGKMTPLSGGRGEYGPGKLTPFAVGMTILILHAVGVPFTGASMNPARSFGPAVVNGGTCWKNHWIYWVGPLCGSTGAALIAHMIFLSSPREIFKVTKSIDQQAAESQEPPSEVKVEAPKKKAASQPKKIILSAPTSPAPVSVEDPKKSPRFSSAIMQEESEGIDTVPLEDIK